MSSVTASELLHRHEKSNRKPF